MLSYVVLPQIQLDGIHLLLFFHFYRIRKIHCRVFSHSMALQYLYKIYTYSLFTTSSAGQTPNASLCVRAHTDARVSSSYSCINSLAIQNLKKPSVSE